MPNLFQSSSSSEESEWLSVSDLMAGLMVIFLFIAIVYIRPLLEQQAKIKELAIVWQENETKIYEALVEEFPEDELSDWDAKIERDPILIRFEAPEVLFDSGSTEITQHFEKILDEFFPRYARRLRPFQDSIDELRIEGHTSSEWEESESKQDAYFRNMELSQGRTRSVLQYVLTDSALEHDEEWVQDLLTANGLSSSKRVFFLGGRENRKASRRVEFRVSTKARRELVRILEELDP